MKIGSYKTYLPLMISFTGILCVAVTFKILRIKINITHSMPIGLYQERHYKNLKRGDIVAVCLPNNIAKEGKKRDYLLPGKCANNTIAVLKRIIAVPHDNVRLNKSGMAVNGVLYYAPHASKDHHHHRIKQFFSIGHYKNTSGYWLYGFNDPLRSWDSRYFGPIPKSAILGVYQPLLTFSHSYS